MSVSVWQALDLATLVEFREYVNDSFPCFLQKKTQIRQCDVKNDGCQATGQDYVCAPSNFELRNSKEQKRSRARLPGHHRFSHRSSNRKISDHAGRSKHSPCDPLHWFQFRIYLFPTCILLCHMSMIIEERCGWCSCHCLRDTQLNGLTIHQPVPQVPQHEDGLVIIVNDCACLCPQNVRWKKGW